MTIGGFDDFDQKEIGEYQNEDFGHQIESVGYSNTMMYLVEAYKCKSALLAYDIMNDKIYLYYGHFDGTYYVIHADGKSYKSRIVSHSIQEKSINEFDQGEFDQEDPNFYNEA